MAPKHDEIIKLLEGGWSVAWDTTEIDEETHRAINKVIADNANALREILAEGFEEAEINVTPGEEANPGRPADERDTKSSVGKRTKQLATRKTGSARAANSRTGRATRKGRTSRSRRTTTA